MNVLILGKIPPGHGDHLWKCREHESSYDGDHIGRKLNQEIGMNVLILGKIPPGHGDHLWKCREHESSYDGDHIERYPVGNRIYAIQVSKILYFTKLQETWRPYLIDRIGHE